MIPNENGRKCLNFATVNYDIGCCEIGFTKVLLLENKSFPFFSQFFLEFSAYPQKYLVFFHEITIFFRMTNDKMINLDHLIDA